MWDYIIYIIYISNYQLIQHCLDPVSKNPMYHLSQQQDSCSAAEEEGGHHKQCGRLNGRWCSAVDEKYVPYDTYVLYKNMDKPQKNQMDTQNDHFSIVSTQTQEAHLGHKTPKFANCESANCGNEKNKKDLQICKFTIHKLQIWDTLVGIGMSYKPTC